MTPSGRSRAQRFPLRAPVRYRANDGPWRSAVTQSISRSGVLLNVDEALPVNTPIEMVVELPPVEGEEPAHVVCKGRVVRSDDRHHGAVVAATIAHYKIDR